MTLQQELIEKLTADGILFDAEENVIWINQDDPYGTPARHNLDENIELTFDDKIHWHDDGAEGEHKYVFKNVEEAIRFFYKLMEVGYRDLSNTDELESEE